MKKNKKIEKPGGINMKDKIKRKIKFLIYGVGFCYILTATMLFTLTFIQAYLTPEKAIIVPVNMQGEALPELITIMFCFPIAIWLFYDIGFAIRKQLHGEKTKEWFQI